jgi:hypothetical protein
MERRPAAELVAASGDRAENNLTMTDPADRSSRNRVFREMFAEDTARHHEILAETELNVDYSGSPIVFGDGNEGIAAGYTIPDTILVQPAGKPPCRLVELTQRPGHTLLLLAGPGASGSELLEVEAALQRFTADSRLFESTVALATEFGLPAHVGQVGPIQIGPMEAGLLGISEITLLAVRPDGYIGLRSDRDHLQALKRYQSLILEGGREMVSITEAVTLPGIAESYS